VQRPAKMRASLHAESIRCVQTIGPHATPIHQLSGLLGAAERAWFYGAAAHHWIFFFFFYHWISFRASDGKSKTKPRRPSLLSALPGAQTGCPTDLD
jgi:hypothetical protein